MSASRFIKVYIIPPAVFQAVGVGGGYGTGREIIQYFTNYGAWGGVYAIAVAASILALILALSFEFCRLYNAYEYRSFFKSLIGRFWSIFELVYFLVFIIVLAVVASAAGAILHGQFGIPQQAGTLIMIALTATLIFFGREWVLKTLTIWTVFMSAVFITYFLNALPEFNDNISLAFETDKVEPGWFISGLKYALICSVIIPAVFFISRDFRTRKESLLSGFISAIFFMLPAFLFHISFVGWMPEMKEIQVPTYWTITQLNMPVFLAIYVVAIFGTFVQTGAGFIQGLNERIDTWSLEKNGKTVTRGVHLSIALGSLLLATGLSHFGIIVLIAEGYSIAGWCLLFIYIIPLLTIGITRIFWSTPNETSPVSSPVPE